MKKILLILTCIALQSGLVSAEQQGAYLGAKPSERPLWFKDSFLEFEEDVAEAASENKRIFIYFHQEGCPYCAKLVEENFADPEIENYIRKNFEGIEINMWGDREIVSIGGQNFTEKTFAAALKVQYTPSVLFLDEQGKVALRLNGYYPPDKFRLALQFVAQKQEQNKSFNEFVRSQLKSVSNGLIDESFYLDQWDLKLNRKISDKYLAVYFEAADCKECEILHQKVLSDSPTRELVHNMDNVQFDIFSDKKIITPDGEAFTQREYAKRLNIGYTPSVVFFNPEGEEVHRIEGFLKTFHFQSSLAYVLEQGYLTEPSFQRFISARGERLREQGFDVDIWGYKSSHPAQLTK